MKLALDITLPLFIGIAVVAMAAPPAAPVKLAQRGTVITASIEWPLLVECSTNGGTNWFLVSTQRFQPVTFTVKNQGTNARFIGAWTNLP